MLIGEFLKKKIDISGVDSLSFLGIADQNIKIIQEQVKAQIVVRGSAMQLEGTKSDIKLIESVVDEMMLTINNKGFIEPEEIRIYIESLSNGEPVFMNGNGGGPVVLYTHKGIVRALSLIHI